MFQVGFHSRAGTPAGFMAHTMVPGLAVGVDGRPLTESHIWAWTVGVPVIGVSGDTALGSQLDGIVAGTPFLPVKRATSRGSAEPLHEDSLEALRTFATSCARAKPRRLRLPDHFTFQVGLDPRLAVLAEGHNGLERARSGVLSLEAEEWGRDVEPALHAAMGAALTPFYEAQGDLDLSTEESLRRQNAADVHRCCAYFEGWAAEEPPQWLT